MRKQYWIGLLLVVLGCAGREPLLYYGAPTQLPNTTREMKSPGYWIARHPGPDRVVLEAAMLEKFNERIWRDAGWPRDIFVANAQDLRERLESDLEDLRRKGFFTRDGRRADYRFFDPLRAAMNLEVIDESRPPRYGVVVRFADQRILPTREPLYKIQGDLDFDELQNSGLDAGTPVAILHASRDGRWLYLECALTRGWVESAFVALGDAKSVREFASPVALATVVRAKADVFLDKSQTHFYDVLRMGAGLPLAGKPDDEGVPVSVPLRKPDGTLAAEMGFMAARDVSSNPLPYTPRNVIGQAFEMLSAPYGWGGMYGEQDCSRFIQQVFATVGVDLPRNSGEQAKVGRLIAEFPPGTGAEEKAKVLAQQGIGGITVLKFRNESHIAIYLGMVAGRPYAIHATWGYREPVGGTERVRLVNRVAVTDLWLGKGTSKGSLLDRLEKIRRISP